MKKVIILLSLLFLANCTYKPLINPETSKDKHTGDNISGNYWKDLHVCRYIHKQNTAVIIRKLGISDEKEFVKKCMKEYGYTTLR